jgi:protein-disulfide isomerase
MTSRFRAPTLLAAAIMLALPAATPTRAQTFSADQKQEIEGIVKNYLLQHPEVMQDVMAELEKHQKAAEAEKNRAAVAENNATIFSSPHQVVLGNPQGNVTMVEFFDYNCGYCKHALSDMLTLLKTDPNLKFVLKEFPVLGEGSVEAAHVAVAARMQDATGKTLNFTKSCWAAADRPTRPVPSPPPRKSASIWLGSRRIWAATR